MQYIHVGTCLTCHVDDVVHSCKKMFAKARRVEKIFSPHGEQKKYLGKKIRQIVDENTKICEKKFFSPQSFLSIITKSLLKTELNPIHPGC